VQDDRALLQPVAFVRRETPVRVRRCLGLFPAASSCVLGQSRCSCMARCRSHAEAAAGSGRPTGRWWARGRRGPRPVPAV